MYGIKALLTGGAIHLAALSGMAASMEYSFVRITSNADVDVASSFTLIVSDHSSGGVLFSVRNSGTESSAIHEVYFDNDPNGPLNVMTLNVNNVVNLNLDGGVKFSVDAVPDELPGANDNPLTPFFASQGEFNTSLGLSADADNPEAKKGVNGGEALGILFTLDAGQTLQSVFAALANGDLRVGIHVGGLLDDESDSFVSNGPVPEPTEYALMFTGLLGMVGGYYRYRKARQVAA
jgi:hypothetical protein